MVQEYIEIRGARENNLKDVSLRLPKRKITIFTGVSGSGKSSVVFDTIANEAQRRLFENFSMFITGVAGSGKSSLINEAFLPQHRDAVVIDQSAMSTSSRSNSATYTGIRGWLT